MTSWQELKARALGESSARCPITGLTESEQDQRDEQVDRWIKRIEQVMEQTGCSAYQALRAIEATNEETTDEHAD